MYSCTFMGTNLHYIMCKYIEFLHTSINKQEEEENTEKKAELEKIIIIIVIMKRNINQTQ